MPNRLPFARSIKTTAFPTFPNRLRTRRLHTQPGKTLMPRLRTPLGLLAAASLLLACAEQERPGTAAPGTAPAAVTVQTAAVASEPLPQMLSGVGSLRADESVTLSSEIEGRVVRIGFQEGRPVTRGQLLFEIDPAIYRAESDQADAGYQLAKRNHDRALELFGRGLISQADRDSAAANFQVSQAARALAGARLAKTRITAPFDGVSGLRRVSPGDYIGAGQELVSIEAMASLKVDFRLPETALPLLATGQPLRVRLDAFPGQVFDGELYAIEPRVADDTRSIGLRARLPNPDGKLRPGLFARVELQAGDPAPTLVIPEQALFPRGDKQFVYVVEQDAAVLREVTLGQRLPGRAEVREGLKAGDAVVITGLQRLSNGTPVTISPAVPRG